MPEDYENQTQTNTGGTAFPAGESRVSDADPAKGEDRSFASRPSDTEAAHRSEEGDSVRAPHQGPIGGDLGRDESKGQLGAGGRAAGEDATLHGLPVNSPGGYMEHQDPAHADDLRKVQEGGEGGGHWELGGERDDTYLPDTVEANRSIEQGNGVGQSEIDLQGNPDRGEGERRFGLSGDNQERDRPGRAPGEDQT